MKDFSNIQWHSTVGMLTSDISWAVLIPNKCIASQLFCISFCHGSRLFVDQTSDSKINLLEIPWQRSTVNIAGI